MKYLYKKLKYLDKKLIAASCIIAMMCFPAFSITVRAGLIGPPPPPENLHCRAQVRAFWGIEPIPRFTFWVEAVGIVGTLYGHPILTQCFYYADDIDWSLTFFPEFDGYVSSPLGGDYEYHYNTGGYQRIGYTQNITFRITYVDTGEHLDFELSARVHLWYGNHVDWDLTPGGQGPWNLILEDATIEIAPEFITGLYRVIGGTPKDLL